MTVTFYSGFSKRRNSTLRPSGGTSKTVVLKENTSLMKPAFVVSTVTWSWNYCTAWQNYYYITDIVAEANGLFRVECELDVMATWKVSIGNYSTLIARAAADQDYNLVDTMYPAKGVPTTKMLSIANPGVFTTDFKSGTFLICTAGKYGQRVYVCSYTKAAAAMSAIFPSLQMTYSAWVDSAINTAVMGGTSNAAQHIIYYKWIPVLYSVSESLATSGTDFYVGSWNLVDGNILNAPVYYIQNQINYSILTRSFTFPARDDAGARGKWLYMTPFASYSVYMPPFGLINIDPAYVYGAGRSIVYDIMVEYLSGNATLRLYYALGTGGTKMIGVYHCNLACDLKQTGGSVNLGGMASGVASAVASYAAGNYAGMAGGIANAAASAMPTGSSVGSGVSGPTADMASSWVAYATYFDPIDENQTELGRPLGKVKQISTLSGYVQTAKAQLALMGHEEEMTKINAILDSGFFYE